MRAGTLPTFTEELAFQEQGLSLVAGIDEAGRGALAGPVSAAAVILPIGWRAAWLDRVRDSKILSPKEREALFPLIQQEALAVGIGIISHKIIDAVGIAVATRRAMMLAVKRLTPRPEALLIDYFRLPGVALPQKGVTHGDSLCISIACASIIAKVARDRIMSGLDAVHRGYGLAKHKGYGTAEHLTCLHRLGPSAIHRRSFQPVREAEAAYLPVRITDD